jgi:hypothetical protein
MCYAKKYQILLVIVVCALFFIPQFAYWFSKTGQFLYDSYKNPGVGLDIFSPHLMEALFSYRKGWLLYTPVMLFAILGFYYLWKYNKKIFPALLISFLVIFYVVASWTEWWYGAGFSLRPMITYYPVLLIPFGYFLNHVTSSKRLRVKAFIFTLIACCIFLNQFQWWQLKNGILDPYRTTKAYYWATFLKTSVTEEEKQLLLVNREIWGKTNFSNKKSYSSKIIINRDFDDLPSKCYSSNENQEFALSTRIPFEKLTSKDHAWVSIDCKYLAVENAKINLAVMMDRAEGPYGYVAFPLDSCDGKWHELSIDYLTPEIRNINDEFKFDFWKVNPSNLMIDDFKVTLFEKK